MRFVWAFSCWLGALSCHSTQPPAPGHAEAPTAVSAPAPAAAGASSSPTAQSAQVEALKPSVTSVELSPVSELSCDARVFVLSGRTFVACGTSLLFVDETRALKQDPSLVAGLKLATGVSPTEIVAMAGRWPDAAWLATNSVTGNGHTTQLRFYRWQKQRWVPAGKSVERGGAENLLVFPWRDGLAAIASSAFSATKAVAVATEPGGVPLLTAAVQSKADKESYPCVHALIAPEASAELGPGDVMVFSGQLCGVPAQKNGDAVGARRIGFERLRAAAKRAELSLLVTPSDAPWDTVWNVTAAVALSPVEVWVAANGSYTPPATDAPRRNYAYLARWDGSAWHVEQAPSKNVASLWAAGGLLWAMDHDGSWWTRRRDGWSRVEWRAPAPAPARPDAPRLLDSEDSQLIAIDSETIWLVRRETRLGPEHTSRIYRVGLN
jgi:hypothetical protein